jgi:hypothetical protein
VRPDPLQKSRQNWRQDFKKVATDLKAQKTYSKAALKTQKTYVKGLQKVENIYIKAYILQAL